MLIELSLDVFIRISLFFLGFRTFILFITSILSLRDIDSFSSFSNLIKDSFGYSLDLVDSFTLSPIESHALEYKYSSFVNIDLSLLG